MIGGKIVLLNNLSCTDVANCIGPYRCIDIPRCNVISSSPTVVYVVTGKNKYRLVSDEAQAKFEEILKAKIRKKEKISQEELDNILLPLIAKNGIISQPRLERIVREFDAKLILTNPPSSKVGVKSN